MLKRHSVASQISYLEQIDLMFKLQVVILLHCIKLLIDIPIIFNVENCNNYATDT